MKKKMPFLHGLESSSNLLLPDTKARPKTNKSRVYCILFLCVAMSFVAASVLLSLQEVEKSYKDGEPVVVDVAQGRIVGQVKTQSKYVYHAFQSIPYAKPPVGERRFKNPEPSDPWEGDLDATRSPPFCPQFLVIGQEDCLYLNIYTPVDSRDRPDPLPVMFFIHGGAFYLGGSEAIYGVHPLLQHEIILVTTNYRLGVLGFLSTEDSAAPGNLGLKDQTLALRWVNDNIAAFGGDTKRITIFGESAGASSVHYQLLAPSAAGLFSGAIMESGSAFVPWSRGRDFRRVSEAVGVRFHCPIEPSEELITCLQKKDYRLVNEMYMEFFDFNVQPFYFAPRIDGDYIPDEPVTLVKNGKYSHVPVMMGVNQDEGSLVAGEMYCDPYIVSALIRDFNKNAQPSLELYDDEKPLETATKVYDHYLGGLNFKYEDADNVTRLYGDRFFMVPLDWLSQMTADVDEVYTWELQHRGDFGFLDLFPGLNKTLAKRWICHGDEIQYIFYPGTFSTPTSTQDLTVSHLFTTMWTNFAKRRNPTPDDSLGFIWGRTNAKDLRHLALTANPPLSMEADKRAKERAFWETLPLRINKLMRS